MSHFNTCQAAGKWVAAVLLLAATPLVSEFSLAEQTAAPELINGTGTPLDPRCVPAADAYTKANAEYELLYKEKMEKCSDKYGRKWPRDFPKKGSPKALECTDIIRRCHAAYTKCASLRCDYWEFCGVSGGRCYGCYE